MCFLKQMRTLLDIIADVMEILSFVSPTSWRDIDDESRIAICVCLFVAAIGFAIYLRYY
jgi:hypothetical protein